MIGRRMLLRRGPAVVAVVALALAGAGSDQAAWGTVQEVVAQGAQYGPAELPHGPPGLPESRTTQGLAPGVTLTQIHRGSRSPAEFWTVDVAFAGTQAQAESVAADLRSTGYEPRIEQIDGRAPDDPGTGPLGYLVRVGRFDSMDAANALRQQLAADGYPSTRSTYTGEDGRVTTGPWYLDVLNIDLWAFRGTVTPKLATGIVPGRDTVTDVSAQYASIAAVNGGYFVIGPQDGTPGDLAGISVVDGRLASEAVNGRTSLIVVPHDGARIAPITTALQARAADGATRLVDGTNRKPGLIRACGGVGGDQPTERPLHDFTCTDESELILFTPDFGTTTEPGDGAEATLDRAGRVVAVQTQRGGSIPPGGLVLSGIGDGAQWLLDHARVGSLVKVTEMANAGGRRLALGDELGVVNGGPRLVRAGHDDITAYAEGFVHPDDPSFYYYFGVRRNPRTIAGLTADGHLLLVTSDGHQPDWSVGLTFQEEAAVLQSLGAVDVVNLDGGGSTTMAVGDQLVNRPSDTTGERPVGDALLLLPQAG
jgi:hypothetical protein